MKFRFGIVCVVTLAILLGPQAALSQPGFNSIVQIILRDRDNQLVGAGDVIGTAWVFGREGNTIVLPSGLNGGWAIDLNEFNTLYGPGSWSVGNTLHIDFVQVAGSYPGDEIHIEFVTPAVYPYVYQPDVMLPVELSLFEATAEMGAIRLSWTTESEINNLGFNLLRSVEGSDGFRRINSELIPGAGNSSDTQNYSYRDPNVLTGQVYCYKLESVDSRGAIDLLRTVSVDFSEEYAVPTEYELSQNFPNPFNPQTTINFQIPEPGRVEITVFNLLGQRMTPLLERDLEAGYHQLVWNGTDEFGRSLGSGVYILRMTAGDYVSHRKVMLLR